MCRATTACFQILPSLRESEQFCHWPLAVTQEQEHERGKGRQGDLERLVMCSHVCILRSHKRAHIHANHLGTCLFYSF